MSLTADTGRSGLRPARVPVEEVDRSILLARWSAMPAPAPRLGFYGGRRDRLRRTMATGLTALTALLAVLVVAAATVVVALA